MREKRGSKPASPSTSPCALLRDAYHNCFHRWYTEKFVKGQYDKQECVSEWQKYKACLSEHLEDKQMIRILEGENAFQDSAFTSQ
ncbi:putative mitochondrial distribution/morphology family 35/apoptosis [Medicago truncatula]|uniref:Protein phosphatase 2C n=1 Tax=Medicago truncatula TaxID=3880 RepID=G7J8C1_MEDTR|nr:uncharacterized protein At4g33100 [Medicago truncatula]XP_024633533.1 uncharacterized protein At4g33100 [Medicago truncatula]AES73428.1 protein phosphatase 2C [Medicago truncatula]RHN70482.1 putative mitochondrial distribution/morphology family 35/apoptosis [Medicago truncatula]